MSRALYRRPVALAASVLAGVSLAVVATSTAQAGTLTGTDTGDSYVTSANATANFGTAGNERVSGSPTKTGYYEFAVSVPAGNVVSSATLALTGVGTQTAQTVTVSSTGTFDETTLNYNNAPAVGAALASGTMNTGVVLNADVTSAITGSGTFAFAVTSAATSDSVIAAKETAVAGAAPVLTVNYSVVNQTPVTNAGPDQTVTMPNAVTLSGSVTDDGLPNPPGATTAAWSKVSGPGTVTFANASSASTTATFSASGSYTLRLTGSDSSLSSSDDVVVTVNPAVVQGAFVPYGSTSYLQTALPANAPVSADNPFFVSWEQANEPVDYWRLRGVANGSGSVNPYGENFGVGTCSDPVYKLASTASVPSGQGFLITTGFHAPTATFQAMAGNNDNPVVIQDTCGNSTDPTRAHGFTMWAANVAYDGTLVLKTSAGTGGNLTGGSFAWGTNGLDSTLADSTAPAGVNRVSRGRIPDSMVITDAALKNPAANGTIGYRPEVFFVETNQYAGDQEPLTGHESTPVGCGGSAHSTICAEGQIVRIDPAVNLAGRTGCSGYALEIAKTLQVYGGYLGDNSGSGSGIKMQQGSTLVHQDDLNACMNLSDLKILQKGYVPPHS